MILNFKTAKAVGLSVCARLILERVSRRPADGAPRASLISIWEHSAPLVRAHNWVDRRVHDNVRAFG